MRCRAGRVAQARDKQDWRADLSGCQNPSDSGKPGCHRPSRPLRPDETRGAGTSRGAPGRGAKHRCQGPALQALSRARGNTAGPTGGQPCIGEAEAALLASTPIDPRSAVSCPVAERPDGHSLCRSATSWASLRRQSPQTRHRATSAVPSWPLPSAPTKATWQRTSTVV